MAKFCKYCGSELEENGVCFCEKAVNERTGVGTTAQIENFDVKQKMPIFGQVKIYYCRHYGREGYCQTIACRGRETYC